MGLFDFVAEMLSFGELDAEAQQEEKVCASTFPDHKPLMALGGGYNRLANGRC